MTPGLHFDVPAADYHGGVGVSNTMLSDMARSPFHCFALHLDPNRPERESTDAQSAGSLAHTVILEPQRFAERYVVRPDGIDYRTNAGKAWRDDAIAARLEPITADEHDTAICQRDAVMRVATLRKLLASGQAEVSAYWTDQRTGLLCRARPDWLHWTGPKRCVALDIKKTRELTPDAVQRAIASYGYHRQAAHYTNGLRALGIEVEEFVFGFVSASYPFVAAAFVLDDETASQGADEVAELLEKFLYCSEQKTWPAFGDGYQPIGLPAWARRENEVEVGYAD